MKGRAYIDGKPVEIEIPADYGKRKRKRAAPFKPTAGDILRAAIAKAKRKPKK